MEKGNANVAELQNTRKQSKFKHIGGAVLAATGLTFAVTAPFILSNESPKNSEAVRVKVQKPSHRFLSSEQLPEVQNAEASAFAQNVITYVEAVDRAQKLQAVVNLINAKAAEDFAKQQAAAQRISQSGPVYGTDSPGGFFACVRQHESNGIYNINTGNGYYGAYQFSDSTWVNTVNHAGRPDLASILPSDASPADQDAMAEALYQWQGSSPWAGDSC